MSISYTGGTIKSGSDSLTEAVDGGFVAVTQSVSITSALNGDPTSATLVLPRSSQIISFTLDKTVLQAGGTATTLPVTIGTVAAGTQYSAAVDMFATARAQPTHTVAQVLAMQDIGTSTSVVVTVDPNGTQTTAGVVRATVLYAQKI